MKTKISVILVNHNTNEYVIQCIESIYKSEKSEKLEIIVVDNSGKSEFEKILKKKFKDILYIVTENKGYASACNIGAKKAKGEYLFFLNPDTILIKNCILLLATFLDANPSVGAVAPLILDKDKKAYPKQAAQLLIPSKGLIHFSLLSRIFKDTYFKKWSTHKPFSIGTIPGTAFFVRSSIFKDVNGFDSNFFLYFEENDLSKKIIDKGYSLFLVPKSQIIHFWGESTKKSNLDLKKIFAKSRFYYFKKHFGVISALLIELFASINLYTILMMFIVGLGTFLRFFKLKEYMIFIGDFGWFYLSAYEFVMKGILPPTGITASRTWLHQGPYWTYLLALGMKIMNDPLVGGVIASLLGSVTLVMLYFIIQKMFSKRIAIIATLLYATSPLIIVFSRMPYHTSPIPLLTILYFYFLFLWVKEKAVIFPFLIGMVALLYNFELATFVFVLPVILLFFYGLLKKLPYVQKILNIKTLILSVLSGFIVMLPMIVYDVSHGFPQTIKFPIWVVIEVIQIFGIHIRNDCCKVPYSQVFSFFFFQYNRVLFLPSYTISLIIFVASILYGIYLLVTLRKRNYKNVTAYILFFLCYFTALLGFVASRTPSEAYLPMLFPFLIISVAVFFDFLVKRNIIFVLLIISMIFFNTHELFYREYFMSYTTNKDGYVYGPGLTVLEKEAKNIVDDANGRQFELKGGGFLGKFDSGIDNYKYLVQWMGADLSRNANLQYTIYQSNEKTKENAFFKDQFIKITR